MKAKTPWGGPNSKRTGSYACGDTGRSTHSWYRWRAIGGDTLGPDQPWRYERECQMSGCTAREFAFELPEVREVDALVAFLDECDVPENESLLERVRAFYTDERRSQLPHVVDPREQPFIEGWQRAVRSVIELRAPSSLDPTGRHQDPVRRELHPATNREQALFAFQRWMNEEDKKSR